MLCILQHNHMFKLLLKIHYNILKIIYLVLMFLLNNVEFIINLYNFYICLQMKFMEILIMNSKKMKNLYFVQQIHILLLKQEQN